MIYQDPRSSSAQWIDKISSFILVNMLWMLFATLIIPLPAATAGLFATLTPWVRGNLSEPFKDFFGGMRQHWRKSTLIALLDAVLAMLIYLDLRILDTMAINSVMASVSRSINFFVAAIILMVNIYVWPLLVTLDLPARQIINIAIKLVFLHPVWSIFALSIALAPLLLGLILPGFLVLMGVFSSCALLASWGAWHILEQHKTELFDG
ncbi:MAG: DUF624 domain-containing protein [Chloroflexi bacterium]|nr:DUF624 domain-containing protein [Chloroflexota bacterium]